MVNEQVSEPNSTQSSESVSDSDDTNCEYTDSCNVVVSAYCSWVKGNAAYGGGGDVWGNFDIVWRQCFDGPWPRWRLHLIWDSGYQVNPDFFYAQARKEVNNFPDPVKGYEELYPGAIHAYNWHAWYPSTELTATLRRSDRRGGCQYAFSAAGSRFASSRTQPRSRSGSQSIDRHQSASPPRIK